MKEIKLRPTGNLLLVQQIFETKENKTSSGILLSLEEADQTTTPTNYCNILRVGKLVTQVKEGDVGMLSVNIRGQEVSLGEEKYMIISETDIVAIKE